MDVVAFSDILAFGLGFGGGGFGFGLGLEGRGLVALALLTSLMYSQTFIPSAVRLWNRLPLDVCYLPPDSFKSKLSKIDLI